MEKNCKLQIEECESQIKHGFPRGTASVSPSPLSCNFQFAFGNFHFAILLSLLFCLTGCSPVGPSTAPDDHLYPLPDFSLTERSGKPIHKSDLAGKVWVAAFVFTRC